MECNRFITNTDHEAAIRNGRSLCKYDIIAKEI